MAAREEELEACQQRLNAREMEVRDVRELLQSSLQPRIAMEPVPRLISLASAAIETDSVPDAQALRQQMTQRRAVHAAPETDSKPHAQAPRQQAPKQRAAHAVLARSSSSTQGPTLSSSEPGVQALSKEVDQQGAVHSAPEHDSSIVRDPTLSSWQGCLAQDMAAEELHTSATAQQMSEAGPSEDGSPIKTNLHEAGEPGSTNPKKRTSGRKGTIARAGSIPLRKHRPAPIKITADASNRENASSPHEQGTPFGQHQVLSRLQWTVQKSASPLDRHGLGSRHNSLHSVPSTPLSPTNASMAPTRRLPQPERIETGMQSEVSTSFCLIHYMHDRLHPVPSPHCRSQMLA